MLSHAAERAARKTQGGTDPRTFLRKWTHRVGIALAEMPKPTGLLAQLSGHSDRNRPTDVYRIDLLAGCSYGNHSTLSQHELSRVLEDAGLALGMGQEGVFECRDQGERKGEGGEDTTMLG